VFFGQGPTLHHIVLQYVDKTIAENNEFMNGGEYEYPQIDM
jgi:hypothetical protein